MKFKGALGMTIALAAIGSYYYLIDIPSANKEKEAKEQSERIVLFEKNQVTNISLLFNDSKISLKKEEDSWNVTEPVKAKSDANEVDSLLNTIKDAKYSRIIEEAPKKLTPFGLKKPKLTLTLGLKEKGDTSIHIGNDSPIGSGLYIKLSNKPAVLLSSISRKDLNKSVYELRDKRILNFSTDLISKVTINRGGTKISFKKKEDNWLIKSGELNSKAEKSEVANLLSSIDLGKIKSFVEEYPEDLTKFGLGKPSIKITLREKENANSYILLIGTKKEEFYYAKTETSKNVFSIETSLVNKFTKDPLSFLNKKVFDFSKKDITKFEIKTQNNIITAVNKSETDVGWKLKNPIQTETDTATISSLLFDLSDAQVQEYIIGKAKSLEPYGLNPPQKSFSIILKNKNKQTLLIGKEALVPGTFFAVRSGESSIFTINKDSLDKIFRTFHELRNKSLVSLKMGEATKIELKYSDKTFELVASGDDWTLTKPKKQKKINSFRARDILWTLNNLEFVDEIEATLTDKITGLNMPELEVSIWNKNNKKLAHVKVGRKTDEDFYYARTEAKPSIFKIKKRFLEEIPNKLEDFKTISPSDTE